MWDLPGTGLEPVSPALAGRFLTTVTPGKPPIGILIKVIPFLFYHYINILSMSEAGGKMTFSLWISGL